MHQQELFPHKKIFSDTVIAYWLSALTGLVLIISLFWLIGFLFFPTAKNNQEEVLNLNERISLLEQKIANLETAKESPKEEEKKEEIVAPEEEKQNIDTSLWQTYSSTNYKFSVKVPNEWKTEKKELDAKSELFEDRNASLVSFVSTSNSVVAFDPEGKNKKDLSSTPKSTMKITIDGKSATKNVYENGLTMILFDEPKNFSISYEQFNTKDKDFFETILSTLKFQ